MGDVWGFLHRNYSIDERREAVALMGVSMGGSAAMTLGIKHRDRLGTVISIMPLLNLRHVDETGKYKVPFRPENHGLRVKPRLHESLGRRKLFTLRFSELFVPIFGRGDQAVAGMSKINPLEVMIREDLQPGELNIFVGYGAYDEFNVAAQAESFIYHAQQRGIEVTAVRDPRGRHDQSSGLRLFPSAINWASPLIPR
jgi:pimeloyl-ACP methyl ester carboxylesterase